MINKDVLDKIKRIFKFTLSSSVVLLTSILFSGAVFIILAIVGWRLSGRWQLDGSFEEWFKGLTGSPVIDGKYSAVDFYTCWSCSIFSNFLDLLGDASARLYIYLSDISWLLIIFGYAVWILNYLYKGIVIDQNLDFKQMFKDAVKKIITISIVSVALFGFSAGESSKETYLKKMVGTIVDNTFVPIFKMGMGISGEIFKVSVGTGSDKFNLCNKLYYPKYKGVDNTNYGDNKNGLLSRELKEDILCFVNHVNIVYLSAMTAGANMLSQAWHDWLSSFGNRPSLLGDSIAGLCMVVIFFLMYILVPFSLIDIVFTLGILVVFLPIIIASYAYQDVERVKNFSKNALLSVWRIAFYMVMYSIFLSIVYSSFLYIADMYYPGPLDGFTYLFPSFMYDANPDILREFTECSQQYGSMSAAGKVMACLKNKTGIEFLRASFSNPGGTFLPMFSFGIISLMIMFGSLKTYTAIIGGDFLVIGQYIQSIAKTTWNVAKSGTRKLSGIVAKKQEKSLYKENVKKQLDNLLNGDK